MNITNILVAFCSLFFFMVGADKFFNFLEPPCSMMNSIPPMIWKFFGVLQLAAGILIWSDKFRKPVVGFFFVFMLVFSAVHLINGTYDIGGSVFMAVLLGLLFWNPGFLSGKGKVEA